MRRRLVAIVNPVSGRRDMSAVVGRVGDVIHERGGRLEIARTGGAGDAMRIARSLEDAVEAVLVVGGDGTASEVVDGLAQRSLPIAILRTGTENLLARELAMPTDQEAIADLLLTGESRPFDVGRVNGRLFVVVTGVGFDAECVERLTRRRTGHISRWTYFRPTWNTFWSHRFPVMTVEADGSIVFEGPGLVLIGVISRYAAGLRVFSRARLDDGLLDLVIFPARGRWQLLPHGVRALLGRHVGRGGVIYRHAASIRVWSSESVSVEVDGDVGGRLPIEIAVVPNAASYLHANVAGNPLPALRDRL